MLALIESIVVSQTVSHTESGSFSTGTITLSGTNSRTYAPETGSIPVTISLSGTQSHTYAAEAGTITVTITLSGTSTDTAPDPVANTFVRDRHHNVLIGG